jgi:hypothetical protein
MKKGHFGASKGAFWSSQKGHFGAKKGHFGAQNLQHLGLGLGLPEKS